MNNNIIVRFRLSLRGRLKVHSVYTDHNFDQRFLFHFGVIVKVKLRKRAAAFSLLMVNSNNLEQYFFDQ